VAVFENGIQEWTVTTLPDGSLQEMKQRRVYQGHSGMVMSVAWHPEGHTLASYATDGTIRLWDAESGKETRRIKVAMPPTPRPCHLVFSPDGRHLAVSNANDTLHIYRLAPPRR
jgi:WD40 repeat protein